MKWKRRYVGGMLTYHANNGMRIDRRFNVDGKASFHLYNADGTGGGGLPFFADAKRRAEMRVTSRGTSAD